MKFESEKIVLKDYIIGSDIGPQLYSKTYKGSSVTNKILLI